MGGHRYSSPLVCVTRGAVLCSIPLESIAVVHDANLGSNALEHLRWYGIHLCFLGRDAR